jgi:hypothetical protein
MSMAPTRGGGGVISLQGLARDSPTLRRLEENLRDDYHRIRTPPVRQGAQETDYPWYFDTSVYVQKRDRTQYPSHLAGQP